MATSELVNFSSEEIKSCCSALYSSDWAQQILGDSFHPGGLRLTETLGKLLHLGQATHLLDVASGAGTSALHLAQTTRCRVTGFDLSPDLVDKANNAAEERGLDDLAHFYPGDAETLPASDGICDALICECAFCTFPEKKSAASEFYRVMKPGGMLGVSDITRSISLPPELETLLAWVACIADARPIAHTTDILEGAGFQIQEIQAHDDALINLIQSVKKRLISADLVLKLADVQLLDINLDEAKSLARAAEAAVHEGMLGYSIVIAQKPGVSPS